jgi:two-component system chemotaxis response regulator CheB
LNTNNTTINVLIVDDSAVVRGLISKMMPNDPNVTVIDTVANGLLAVKLVNKGDVHIVVLDIEMPVMDGLTALPQILAFDPEIKVIIASTLTMKNAEISLKALESGAADYITKPSSSREMTGGKDFQHELLEKIKNLSHGKIGRPLQPATAAHPKIVPGAEISLRRPVTVRAKPRILVIGSSTGGPQALFTFFKGLNGKLPIPALVTQHMPQNFTKILAQHLTKAAGLPAAEAEDDELVQAGHIYVAPGDCHMQIQEAGAGNKITLNQNPPENFCRPAVNPMLRSVAQHYGSNVIVVILTGMGYDGMKGGEDIVAAGGTIIAQDEKSSVVWGMPGAVASAGLCTAVLPIDELAPYVAEFMDKGM